MRDRAEKLARHYHREQRRKWGERLPYAVHLERVAAKVASLPGMADEDVAAAWLHDAIEDVAIPENRVSAVKAEIVAATCETVLALVLELTNPTEGPEWKNRSRAEKREADWAHLRVISDRAKRIKLVDRWDNVGDFAGAPRRMIEKYVPESRVLLSIIRHVDEGMACELEGRIDALAKRVVP